MRFAGRLCAALLWLAAGIDAAVAADATLSWDSLNGEQQYALAPLRARWDTLDTAQRQTYVRQADALWAARAARGPAPAQDTKPPTDPTSGAAVHRHQRHGAATADIDFHSSRTGRKLQKALRKVPGLSLDERNALLASWPRMTSIERQAVLERFTGNDGDSPGLDVEKERLRRRAELGTDITDPDVAAAPAGESSADADAADVADDTNEDLSEPAARSAPRPTVAAPARSAPAATPSSGGAARGAGR